MTFARNSAITISSQCATTTVSNSSITTLHNNAGSTSSQCATTTVSNSARTLARNSAITISRHFGGCGGQVVSVLAFLFQPSEFEFYSFSGKFALDKNKNKRKEVDVGTF